MNNHGCLKFHERARLGLSSGLCMAASLLIALLLVGASTANAAMSFKGVLDAEGTITFYYDDVDHSAEGTVKTHTLGSTGYSPWKGNTDILRAVFTTSCSSAAWTKGLQYFFYGCSNLTTVEGLGNLNMSDASSLLQMFYGCSSLTTLDSGGLKSPKVTNFGDMFYNCSSLETLDISSLSSESAGQCGNMFRGCSNLKTIYVNRNFDLSGLASQWVFTSSTKLVGGNGTKHSSSYVHASYARIDRENYPGYFTLKTQTLSIADSEFAEKHIVSVVVTRADDGTVVEPDEVGGLVWTLAKGEAVNVVYTAAEGFEFSGASTYVDSEFASEGVSRDELLEGARLPTATAYLRYTLTVDASDFESQHVAGVVVVDAETGDVIQPVESGVYSMVPGKGFTVSYRAVPGYFFANYISATNDQTYLSEGLSENVTRSITPRAAVTLYGMQIKGVLSDDDPTTMTLYCDNSNHEGIVYARKAPTGFPSWSNLDTIRRVVVDSSMRINRFGDGGDGFQYLFYGLSSMTNIEGIANLRTEKATNFTQMFYTCRALTELDLSKMKTPCVAYFGEMFRYCNNLRVLDMSGFSRGNVDVSCGFMFNGCTKLTTIYVNSRFNLVNTTYDNYMFTGCNALVGGNGTKAQPSIIHYANYAHVDEPGNPGYFTLKPKNGSCLIFR